jgi:hypothetical protein
VSAPTQRDTSVADADSSGQINPQGKSKSGKGGSLEQFAKNAAKTPTQPTQEAVDDDPEIDFDGEKYKKSQLADLAKKRREYDRAASLRMQEAAKIQKAATAREAELTRALEQFKANPWALFEQAGINPDEVAEQRLAAQLKRQQMTPEAIELETARAELQRLQKEQAEFAEQQKKAQHEQQVKHWLGFFDKAIGTALETAGIPRTASTAQRVRQAYEDLVDAGHKIDDATGAMAVDLARDEMMTGTQQLLSEVVKTSPKMLLELLGGLDGEVVKTIQRMAVERHNGAAQPKPKPKQPNTPQVEKPREIPTLEDVRKRLGVR